MNKLYALLIGAFTPLCMSAQTTYPEWQSQYTTGLNKVEPHAYVLPYSSVDKLQQPGGYEQSAYYMTLNGKWKFHWTKNPDKRPKDFFQNDFAVQGWNDINVPGNWERQGYGLPIYVNETYEFDDKLFQFKKNPPLVPYAQNEVGSYRRTFTIPSTWKGRRIVLCCEGVKSFFYLWINGTYVGYNMGAKMPSEWDITKYLHDGENTIAMEVYRWAAGSYLECQDYWRISASIQALIAGETVAGSRISNRLLTELIQEGLLQIIIHGSRKSYRANNIEALKRFLIDKDENYRILDVDNIDSRSSMASETGNSKLVTVRSCPGFPVNTYEPIECRLNEEPFIINPQEGCFLFVSDWRTFTIPEDVTIIGIENMENFRKVRQQRLFFNEYLHKHSLSQKVLFVSRYPQSTDLREWLASIPNLYIHFGDFDLAGIHIFLSEFQKHLGIGRTSLLIPEDISSRLSYGSARRYNEQYARYKDIKSDRREIQQLIDLIHHERKGYDQEGYISQ